MIFPSGRCYIFHVFLSCSHLHIMGLSLIIQLPYTFFSFISQSKICSYTCHISWCSLRFKIDLTLTYVIFIRFQKYRCIETIMSSTVKTMVMILPLVLGPPTSCNIQKWLYIIINQQAPTAMTASRRFHL